MAHHSQDFDPEMSAHFAEMLKKLPTLPGPTGQFPLGKLTAHDEGELAIAIGAKDGNVILDFGKPTVWIGFTPTQARLIAQSLNEKADALDPIVTVQIPRQRP